MPWSDIIFVIRWWGALVLIGAAAYPLTSHMFPSWHDRGYLFAKAVGLAVVTWVVYILGIIHLVPFTTLSIFIGIAGVFGLGFYLNKLPKVLKEPKLLNWRTLFFEELFFFVALLFWSWIKGHEPSLRGLEKFMDYGFMNSILHSTYFPPTDMWYPPYPINYYYFGHMATAVLTRLSGIDLAVTFNLMLATIFAWCFTMSYGIARQLLRIGPIRQMRQIWQVVGALFTAFLVTSAGNMQTIYAFTRGYTGEAVKPFWELLWPLADFWQKLPEGLNTYWYANATRFIPYTIHEFPSYSFVVSDIHGHVLSIPFVLLAIALLISIFTHWTNPPAGEAGRSNLTNLSNMTPFIFYGFLCGVLLMTNALDGPIYFGLFGILFVLTNWSNLTNLSNWSNLGIVAGSLVLTSLPFLSHFKSFVNGVAVDCPPAALANAKYGPLLFETVDKCQKSPIWMMYLLWGFFWFCGAWLILSRIGRIRQIGQIGQIWQKNFSQTEKILVVFFVFSVLLLVFPEFFYFKDIYPQHFRSNTMFKLGYQAYIMYSLMSGYVIVTALSKMRQTHFISQNEHQSTRSASQGTAHDHSLPGSRFWFLLLLVPQLFLVSIYPIFAVRSYFGGLTHYESLNGLGWMSREYPDDYAAINWFNSSRTPYITDPTRINLVEADGDSYTDYERFSVFAGMPTVVGWSVHEWLWRGSYDVVAPRKEDVRLIYESKSPEVTKSILDRYHVAYVVVGSLERQKFKELAEEKFSTLGKVVFSQGATTVYQID
jgi:uncharacterized membrane protein